jgi:hypothetical protein
MLLPKFASLLLVLPALAVDVPLPTLRVEPTAGGSIFFVKNIASQPLTAYLIELVGYPGTTYSFWQDNNATELIPAGVEQQIPVTNMTVGAVPEYVKMQAAVYADGSSGGIPGKVTQLVERRRSILATTRELIHRMDKAQAGGSAKPALIAELKQWTESMEPIGKSRQFSQAAINQAAARGLIGEIIGQLNGNSPDAVLDRLRAAERSLSASKPAL